ncbi:MAG: hypothetical protein ACXQTD_05910 [Candidatus Syntropharchaeia archaeon]
MRIKFTEEEVRNLIQILDDFSWDCAACGYDEWVTTAEKLKRKLEKAINYSWASVLHRKHKSLRPH